MKKSLLIKVMLLLCALVAGSESVWAQSDYSAVYTSNVTLSANGTKSTASTVVINATNYDAMKLGTNGNAGNFKVTFPKDTKYIHIHAAGWNGKSNTLSFSAIAGTTYSPTFPISLKANTGVSGSTSTYTFGSGSGDATPNSTDHYKVITLSSALSAATEITISCSERCLIWGVNSEAASTDPSSEVTFANKTPSINYPATKTYSQAPTTAAGYEGTITYTMTANTAGATIDSGTGLVTVTQGGSVTVKALAAAVAGKFAGSDDTYTLTVNDTRPEAELSWSAASANATYGADNNIFPTLTNTHSVPVTYESTNQAAASINENTGEITLKDYTGNTTISAIFAGNDDYLPKTVTYTLNVKKAPFAIKDGVFDFVGAASADPFEDYGSGVTTTSTSSSYVTNDKTWIAGNVTMVTSKVSGSGYRWWENDGTLRFYNESKATFSVPSGYVITKIVTTGANFDKVYDSKGTLSSSTWTGAHNEVALGATGSRNIKTITVTYTTENQFITPSKTYTTLTSAYALDFTSVSNNLKAYIATEVNAGSVQMTQVNKVPAGTGLVLKATTPGSAVNVPVFDGTGADDVSENQMVGSATATTAVAANGGYILKDGIFQPALEGTLPAGKAYLNIAVSAPTLILNFDETTGVNEVRGQKEEVSGEYYNLAGQRVAQPTKGLYIVNGRKVVIK